MQPHMMMPTGTIKILQDCSNICFKTFDMLLSKQDANSRKLQIKLLADCGTICDICAKFMASNSIFMRSMSEYCSYVCEVCGNECLKYQIKNLKYADKSV